MPTYLYKCHQCKRTFEVRHGMFFENQKCIHCHSSEVFKVPSIQQRIEKDGKTKTGSIVDKYIKDAKKEISDEKKKLKSEEY